jgi:hypothetical protein
MQDKALRLRNGEMRMFGEGDHTILAYDDFIDERA